MGTLNASGAGLASAPGSSLRAVTPSDSVALPAGVCRALIVGVAGNIAILAEDDTAAVTLVGIAAGQVLPIRAQRVNATGTTATSIIAIY